jgi:hypothetical protein
MDLLAVMHENDERGEITGTHASLARIARCTEAEMRDALREINVTKTGHVTVGHANVTVLNRRMARAHKERVSARERKQKQRGTSTHEEPPEPDVTETSRSYSSSSSSTSVNTPPKSPSPKKRFTKPTLDEVAAYCRERGNTISASIWFDHYESNGWRVGKNPMKDWRASVRYWEQNRPGGNGAAGKAHSDGPRPSAVERVERATRSGGRTFDAEP